MPRAALSRAEIDAFRESLCEVAARRFGEHGYAGVTLRALAAELGVSPMTPYRYFRDKDEIFAAVRAAAFGRFADSQWRVFGEEPDPEARLTALSRAYVDFARTAPHDYRLIFEMNRPNDRAHAPLVAEAQRAWEPLRRAVAEAITAGVLAGDPDTVAHLFWAGLHGLVSLELAGTLQQRRTLDELLAPMERTLIEGNRPQLGGQEDRT